MRPKLERWFHSPDLIKDVRADLARNEYHVVHLDELLLARIVPPRPDVPIVQHHHKLDTVLYHRLNESDDDLPRRFDLWKLRRLEAESARRYRHHLLCSQEDAALLRSRHGALDCAIVPSGFDPDYYHRPSDSAQRDPRRLLFLGTMNYGPNVDGIRAFVSDALPHIRVAFPDTLLEIVGGEPAPEVRALAGEGIVVTGRVPDVRPYLERAAMLVVPLRVGGGTRLKIVEAAAMETPVVSTRIGAEGLGLVEGQHFLAGDTAADLARHVVALLGDPARARSLGRAASVHVRERFSWEALGEELVDYWEGVKFAGNLSASR
jgi:glycosyltransferase involved in cell wall biosynthesis